MMEPARCAACWSGAVWATLLVCGSCAPPDAFASVELLVREPFRTERLGTEFTTLIWDIDGVDAELDFKAGALLQSSPIVLGQHESVVTVSLAVGKPVIALGAGDPFTIPALADATGGDLVFESPLILAAPNTAELLDDQRPPSRSGVTVCPDPTKKAWFFGGFDSNGSRVANGYAFNSQTLIGKDTVITDLVPGDLACDSDGAGSFVLVEGGCEGSVAGPNARLSVGRENRARESNLARSLCGPRLSVAEGQVWIASRGRIDRFALDSIGSDPFPPGLSMELGAGFVPRDAVAMSADVLLVATEAGVTVVRAADGRLTSEVSPVEDPLDFGKTPSGKVYLLIRNGTVFRMDENGKTSNGRVIDLDGVTPQQLEMLPDGRAAVLGPEGLVIEHSRRTQRTIDEGGTAVPVVRDGMAVTVGGAVVLVGGGFGGTDVVVPEPFTPAEE